MDFSGERDKPIFIVRKKELLRHNFATLYHYLATKLGIKKTPKLILKQDEHNAAKPFGKTGHYDPSTETIVIFITDRHNTDILRSFAHEVIHHWQNENGTLSSQASHEHYAQNDENLRKREMEAYLFGNILFRDWQDENRYGPPAHPPLMPQPINEMSIDLWRRWVDSMVITIENYRAEENLNTVDEGWAYDILKTDYRAESPNDEMFSKACGEALQILKRKGVVHE
jgi:hypothetical protein